MSLLARGSQAADSPWAESAERGHSLLGVLRGETPRAGYRGGALIGTGQSPGPRQSPQLRKAKRVVIVGYNRPAFLSPHAPASFFSLLSFLSLTFGATGRRMGRVIRQLGFRGQGSGLSRTDGQGKGVGQPESPQSPSQTPPVTASDHREMKGRGKGGMTVIPSRFGAVGIKKTGLLSKRETDRLCPG